MKRKLPPLNAIKAFEAAARHLSFTAAASELNVTQGAISKQIKILEDYFGKKVFTRNNNKLKLTKSGKKYFNDVQLLFKNLERATISLNGKTRQELIINSFPSFAYYILVPKVDSFYAKDFELNIVMDDKEINFEKGAKIAIRGFNKLPKTGDIYEKIYEERLVAVCNKEYLKNHPINSYADFPKAKLLEHSSRKSTWKKFLVSRKVAYLGRGKIGLEHFLMLIEAAKEGKGIALVPEIFVRKYIKNGELITPLSAKPYTSGYNYYAVYQKPERNSREVIKLLKWLKECL